jgi:hypothetical protein
MRSGFAPSGFDTDQCADMVGTYRISEAAPAKTRREGGDLEQIERSTVMTRVATTAATLAFVLLLGAGNTALGQSAHEQHHPQQPAQQSMPMQPGMMGPGMMGPGMTGPGMMGPGVMGHGMMGPGMQGFRVVPMMHLSTDDVRQFLQRHISAHGLEHLQVGDVTQTDDQTITADIVTREGSLALRLEIDAYTGFVTSMS